MFFETKRSYSSKREDMYDVRLRFHRKQRQECMRLKEKKYIAPELKTMRYAE